MKWKETPSVQKTITVVGFVCGVAFFLLEILRYCDILTNTQPVEFALFSIFWLGMGIRQEHKVLAAANYILAAGYLMLSLLYLFTR